MKRTILAVCVAAALSVAARAEEFDRQILSVTTTDGTATQTCAVIRGPIEEISIDAVTTPCTGTVLVVLQPEVSTLSAVTIVTKSAVTADTIFRPRVDCTDTGGTALTGDPPTRFVACGETLRFEVSAANPTGVVWKAVVKWGKR